MKTILLFLSLFTVLTSIAQKEPDLILEISKLDQSDFFYISLGEEIIFSTFTNSHKTHGFVSDIQKDSIQIDDTYYITHSEIKSLISKKERKILQTKAWGTTLAGLLLSVGGGALLQARTTKISQKIIGGAGVIFGVPYFVRGIRMITESKMCPSTIWEIKSVSLEIN